MKEYPEPNYFLSVSLIEESIDPQLGQLLPRTYRIEVNRVMACVLTAWLPTLPWPPSYPRDWDHWRDRDEAARYLLATNPILITPTTKGEALIETVIFDEYPDMEHTIFWVPKVDYEALLADVERAYSTPFPSSLRLDDLDAGPLAEFLKCGLAKASLSTYIRRILCLDPLPGRST
jgi:hypothetical protein